MDKEKTMFLISISKENKETFYNRIIRISIDEDFKHI